MGMVTHVYGRLRQEGHKFKPSLGQVAKFLILSQIKYYRNRLGTELSAKALNSISHTKKKQWKLGLVG